MKRNPQPILDHDVYVFRNESRGRGLGFFVADGFYPDFMIWLVAKDGQKIVFVDAMGIRNIGGFEHPKLRFYRTIKEVEVQIRESKRPTMSRSNGTVVAVANVRLHAFILSTTARARARRRI